MCTLLQTLKLQLAIIFIKVPPQQNEHIEFKFAFKKNVFSIIVNFVKSKIHKNYQHTAWKTKRNCELQEMWPLDFPNKVSQKSKISIIVKSSKHYIKQFKQLSLYSTLTFSLIEASLSTQKVLEILKRGWTDNF